MAYLVLENALVYKAPGLTPLLAVETPAWYALLEEMTRFSFRGQQGAFSARKERASHGRGGYYWRAYRRERGKLRRVYLGKSEQLTMARLEAAAQKLACPAEQGARVRAKRRRPSVQMAVPTSRESREMAAGRAFSPLLRTKLHMPAFQEQRVSRTHLVRRLNMGMKSSLILLSAAAGSGKTTLLSEWARQAPVAIAWVSLDKEDNDPVRFWSYILASLRQTAFHEVEEVLAMFSSRPLAPFQSILSACIYTVVLSTATTLILKAVRDVLFVLAMLPVIAAVRRLRWSTGLYIALIGVVLEAWIPLLGQTSWPAMMRVGNLLELTGAPADARF